MWRNTLTSVTISRVTRLENAHDQQGTHALRIEPRQARLASRVGHQWQQYHLDTYLDGISALEAFQRFGMDAQIQYFQLMGQFWLVDADFAKFSKPQWVDEVKVISDDPDNRIAHTPSALPGNADLQNRRRPQDHLDHRVPHQTRRGHRADPQYMPVPALDPKPSARHTTSWATGAFCGGSSGVTRPGAGSTHAA